MKGIKKPIKYTVYDTMIKLSCNVTLQWRHNGRNSVSNHQPHDCLLNRLFRRRSKKISKLRVTGLCAGNSPGTGEFPAQMVSNAENVSIWWRHHGYGAPAIPKRISGRWADPLTPRGMSPYHVTTQFYCYPVMSKIQNSINIYPWFSRRLTWRTRDFGNT